MFCRLASLHSKPASTIHRCPELCILKRACEQAPSAPVLYTQALFRYLMMDSRINA